MKDLIHQITGLSQAEVTPLSGGDINSVFQIKTTDRNWVIKLNAADLYPNMLQQEAFGLQKLASTKKIGIPEVIDHGIKEGNQYLILTYISPGRKTDLFWENFGGQLAALHQTAAAQFGLETDNYIGSLNQSNKQHASWNEFFISERLIPQLKLAIDAGIINRNELKQVEAIYPFCQEIWPEELPSLLHGDLWSGNFIASTEQQPFLIDPAVYFGHREMDIGMMHLFGGFDPLVFEKYNDAFPLEKGWENRIQYNQLYPLLVHLNLFGRGYWAQIESIVSSFL